MGDFHHLKWRELTTWAFLEKKKDLFFLTLSRMLSQAQFFGEKICGVVVFHVEVFIRIRKSQGKNPPT